MIKEIEIDERESKYSENKVKETNTDNKDILERYSIIKDVFSILKGSCIATVIIISDLFAVGTKYFDLNLKEEEKGQFQICKKQLDTLSFILYNVTVVLSTFIYTNFTGLKAFIFGTAIAEVRSVTMGIARIVFDHILSVKYDKKVFTNDELKPLASKVVLNTYIVSMIFVFSVAVTFFIIFNYKIGNFLKKIPILARNVFGSDLGILLIMLPLEPILKKRVDQIMPNLAVLFLMVLVILLFDKYLNYLYAPPCLLVISCLVVFIFKNRINKDDNLINQDMLNFSFNDFRKVFSYDDFKLFPGLLPKCFTLIVKGVITSIIHFTINIMVFSSSLDPDTDINNKFAIGGIANFVGVFTGIPVYVSSSNSINFNVIGCKSKLIPYTTIIILIVFNLFILNTIIPYVPNLFPDSFALYIGIISLKSSVIDFVRIGSLLDSLILILGVLLARSDPLVGFFFTFTIIAGKTLIEFTKSYSKTMSTLKDDNYIKINYILCYMSLDKFEKDLKDASPGTVLDLNDCFYVDADANMMLIDYLKKKKITKIIGKPRNLYIDKISELCEIL